MDIWGLRSILGDGDGIHQAEGQCLVLGCRFYAAPNQHVLGFYRVSRAHLKPLGIHGRSCADKRLETRLVRED